MQTVQARATEIAPANVRRFFILGVRWPSYQDGAARRAAAIWKPVGQRPVRPILQLTIEAFASGIWYSLRSSCPVYLPSSPFFMPVRANSLKAILLPLAAMAAIIG